MRIQFNQGKRTLTTLYQWQDQTCEKELRKSIRKSQLPRHYRKATMRKLPSLQRAVTSVISVWTWHMHATLSNERYSNLTALRLFTFRALPGNATKQEAQHTTELRKKSRQAHTINSLKLRNYWWSKAVLGHTIIKRRKNSAKISKGCNEKMCGLEIL